MKRACILALVLFGCGDDDAAPIDAVDALDTTVATEVGPDVVADAEVVEVIVPPADRQPGERRARTSRCEPVEDQGCIVWPSNALMTTAATPTGLRFDIDDTAFLEDEGIPLIEDGDGFSRVAPIVVRFPAGQNPDEIGVRIFVSEGERFGDGPLLRRKAYDGVLVVYPTRPLAPATEYTVIVNGFAATHATRVALGLEAPATQAEADLAAYHAPARAIVDATGLNAQNIARVWDFTTKSAEAPLTSLRAMADSARGDVTVTVDTAVPGDDPIALVLEGHIGDIPDPIDGGIYTVPFRVVVPSGEGDFHVIMYAHGAAGNVHDTSFDGLIAGAGAAKVSIEIDGWTDDTLAGAVSELFVPLVGTDKLVKRMRRSLAGGVATLHALDRILEGRIGDRHALQSDVVWAGGSLGGVTGMVFGHLEPSVLGGLLNVPGAGFTHWLSESAFYGILSIGLESRYPALADLQAAIAMAQQLFDEVDGASWAHSRAPEPIFLVQMSVGDPVMPNIGTAMVATSLDATIVGGAPVAVPGLSEASEAIGTSALTEYVTDRTSSSDVHGFAGTDAPAGIAARAQFAAFIASLWAHAPQVTIPDACMMLEAPLGPAGTCDFKE